MIIVGFKKIIENMRSAYSKLKSKENFNIKHKLIFRPNTIFYAIASIVIIAILVNVGIFKDVFNKSVLPLGVLPSSSSLAITTPNNDNKGTPIINPILNNMGKIVVDSDTILKTIIKSKDGGFVTIGNKSKGSDAGAVIFKFDNHSKKEWSKSLANTGAVQSFIQTEDGGYISIINSSSTPFIYKFDNNGNIEWSKTLDDGNDIKIARLNKVIQTDDKNFIAVGHGNNNTITGAVIIKFNNSGSIIWKVIGEASDTFSADFKSVIQADDSGLVVIGYSGLINSALTFKSTVYALSIIVKFDNNGNKLWSQYSSSSYGLGSIVQTDSGEFLVSGYLNDEVFKNFLHATLSKYSNNGSILWEKNYYESYGMDELSIFKTDENSIIGISHPFICKFDNNGNIIWINKYCDYDIMSNNYIWVKSLVQSSEDGYICCGKGYGDGRACIFFFDKNGKLRE